MSVDDRVDTVIFSLSADDIDVVSNPHGMSLVDPQGRIIDEAVADADPLVTMYTESPQGPIRYVVASPAAGLWSIRHSDTLTRPRVLAGLYSDVFADLKIEGNAYGVGDTLSCTVTLSNGEVLTDVSLAVAVRVEMSAGEPLVVLGNVTLQESAPGIWTGIWPNVAAGRYELELQMSGTTSDQQAVSRGCIRSAWVDPAVHDVTSVPRGTDDPVPHPVRAQSISVSPNPFNASTEVAFSIPSAQHVKVVIYSIDGREVLVLADGVFDVGVHVLPWAGRDQMGHAIASGVYAVVMRTADGQSAAKTVLLK
jgi:hypothetical protein